MLKEAGMVYRASLKAERWIIKKNSAHTLTLSRIPKPPRDGDGLVECSCCSLQTLMLVFSCICISYSRTSSRVISAKAGERKGAKKKKKPWAYSVRNTQGGVWKDILRLRWKVLKSKAKCRSGVILVIEWGLTSGTGQWGKQLAG